MKIKQAWEKLNLSYTLHRRVDITTISFALPDVCFVVIDVFWEAVGFLSLED